MKISSLQADQTILAELGERLLRIRLEHNLRQIDLAKEAGISRNTVARLESGEVATQLVSFLRVCRVLGVLDRFEALLPEAKIGPMEALKFETKGRQRAMSPERKARKAAAVSAGKPWVWGDGGGVEAPTRQQGQIEAQGPIEAQGNAGVQGQTGGDGRALGNQQ